MKQAKRTGNLGEELACRQLERAGYEIVDRNWRCPGAEVDIIARQNDIWVFVEVKARHSRRTGYPEEAVTPAKIERIERAAEQYLAEHADGDAAWRIDVVAIELDRHDRVASLRILQGLNSEY